MSPVSLRTGHSSLESGRAKLWLLLVGVNEYEDDTLPSLQYSALDCQGLSEALSGAIQVLPRKEMFVCHDFAAQAPRKDVICASLRRIVLQAQSQDTVLFYFSGHGVLEPQTQQVVLCLADTYRSNLLDRGLGLHELLQMLDECQARQQLIWLDTCHSGGLSGSLRGVTRPEADPTVQLVEVLRRRAAQSKRFDAFLSCDQGQQSWEFPELGHGLFTYYLMRGLWGEAADLRGVIEADKLYKYVYNQTSQYIDKANQQLRLVNQQKRSRGETSLRSEYPLQTPKRIMEGVGDLILGFMPVGAVAQAPRQALIIEGLSGNHTTLSLGEVLRTAGGFELEYWPQPGKAWPEVREALQACLCWRSPAEREPGGVAPRQIASVLLYLRGQIEEIEEGEAWLVLADGVRLSRSWLKQQLRSSGMAQQIVVLDCPGAVSLAEWVEQLQLEPGHGQCLIAAASVPEDPDRFARVLLETLVAEDPQAGLTIAGWITQLQVQLARAQIALHVRLSGAQGVIEVLPGRVATATEGPDLGLWIEVERILASAQTLAREEQWVEALRQAELVSALPGVAQRVEPLINQWQKEQQALDTLREAEAMAENKQWEEALRYLKAIPAQTVSRSRAVELEALWSQHEAVKPTAAADLPADNVWKKEPAVAVHKISLLGQPLQQVGTQVLDVASRQFPLPVLIGGGIALLLMVLWGMHNSPAQDQPAIANPPVQTRPARPEPSVAEKRSPPPAAGRPVQAKTKEKPTFEKPSSPIARQPAEAPPKPTLVPAAEPPADLKLNWLEND